MQTYRRLHRWGDRSAVACQAFKLPASTKPAVVSRRTLFHGAMASLSALAILPPPSNAAELLDLVEPLKAFDVDGSGTMDVSELQAAFQQALGVEVPEIAIQAQVVPALDFNDDGVVSTRQEFLRGMSLQLPVDADYWRVADTDGDGTLTLRELKAAVGDVGGEAGDVVIRAAFKQADRVPRDGRLTPSEAADAMRALARAVLMDR